MVGQLMLVWNKACDGDVICVFEAINKTIVSEDVEQQPFYNV